MKNDFGQYFTPKGVAEAMVALLKSGKDQRILEPSAGEGVFLDALDRFGFKNIDALEIDESLVFDEKYSVEYGSFVTWKPERGYSAVIGNPPYIRWKNLQVELQEEVKSHRLWGTLFNSLSDYLTVFIANSVEHLEDGGELVFITPSFWMGTKHSEKLRNWLLNRGSITDLVTFGESQVFKGVSSAIIVFRFEKSRPKGPIRRFKYLGGRRVPESVDFFNPSQFEMDSIPGFEIGKHWTVANAFEQKELTDFELSCRTSIELDLLGNSRVARLGDFVRIANGMVSGLDKAFQLPGNLENKLNSNELNSLIKVAKAKDLAHLRSTSSTTYIDVPKGLTEDEFVSEYPNFAKHFEPFKQSLLMRYSYGRELPYWEWAFRRSEEFITNLTAKGFVPCKERITNRKTVRFALVEPGTVATQDVTAFAPLPGVKERIEYIVGFLSTEQVSNWIRLRGLIKGGIAEFSEKPLSEIPFRPIDWDNQDDVDFHDSVVRLVSSAIHAKDTEKVVEELSELFGRMQIKKVCPIVTGAH